MVSRTANWSTSSLKIITIRWIRVLTLSMLRSSRTWRKTKPNFKIQKNVSQSLNGSSLAAISTAQWWMCGLHIHHMKLTPRWCFHFSYWWLLDLHSAFCADTVTQTASSGGKRSSSQDLRVRWRRSLGRSPAQTKSAWTTAHKLKEQIHIFRLSFTLMSHHTLNVCVYSSLLDNKNNLSD